LISCKEEPNYNPFDNQFDVSVRQLIADNCDTIPAGCGYFNLIKRTGKLRPYYQFYMEDPFQIVAKGFTYEIDTFSARGYENKAFNKVLIDSVINLPINEKELSKEIEKFGYQFLSRKSKYVLISNEIKMDTIQLQLDVYPIHGNRSLVRGIGYFWSSEIMNHKNEN